MTSQQKIWLEAKKRLEAAVTSLGFPAEFAGLLAQHLGSPVSIDRMTAYLYRAQPESVEMIVDEMVAICTEADSWRRRKEGREAQAGYSAWLSSPARLENLEEIREQTDGPAGS